MMTVKQLRTKTRFLVFFFISLVLPSLFLAYLSLRGIQSDQAAAEQELLDGHRAAARTIIDLVESELDRIELLISHALEHPPRATGSELQLLAEQLRHSSPLVSEPFVITGGRVFFPLTTRLYHADNGPRLYLPTTASTTASEALLRGTQLEFQSQDLESARQAYTLALEKTSNQALRVQVEFDLARTLRRLSKNQQAKTIYDEIIRTYCDFRVAGGIPADLAARLELLDVLASGQDASGRAKAILAVQADLAHGAWDLTKPQFEFACARVRESWSRLATVSSSSRSRYQKEFEEREASMRAREEVSRRLVLFERS
jgi:tetratricopeptide (TPR) repeat protein